MVSTVVVIVGSHSDQQRMTPKPSSREKLVRTLRNGEGSTKHACLEVIALGMQLLMSLTVV